MSAEVKAEVTGKKDKNFCVFRVRKNKFMRELNASKNPKIIKKWEYSGFIDGIEHCRQQYTKEQFLKFIAFSNTYSIMRVDAKGEGLFTVYDKYGGALYSFEVELR